MISTGHGFQYRGGVRGREISSDCLLDGTYFSSADVYTHGYHIALVFPLLVVATLISRFRNPDGFKMMVAATD
jgi:hypothetical protein